MLNLLRAEWRKLTGNRLLSGFTAGAYPLGAFVFLLFGTVMLHGFDIGEGIVATDWRQSFNAPWQIVTVPPVNIINRLPLLAFMAVAFAGEYEWSTWKNLLPHNRRGTLIVVKHVMLAWIATLSLFIASVIWGFGLSALLISYGLDAGPLPDQALMLDFLPEFGLNAGIMFLSALLLAGFAGLAALLTRSIVGGLLLGFGLSVLEALLLPLTSLIALLFEVPEVVDYGIFTPDYAFSNIRSWLLAGESISPQITGIDLSPELWHSALVVAAWIGVLVLLNIAVFRRQDITA